MSTDPGLDSAEEPMAHVLLEYIISLGWDKYPNTQHYDVKTLIDNIDKAIGQNRPSYKTDKNWKSSAPFQYMVVIPNEGSVVKYNAKGKSIDNVDQIMDDLQKHFVEMLLLRISVSRKQVFAFLNFRKGFNLNGTVLSFEKDVLPESIKTVLKDRIEKEKEFTLDYPYRLQVSDLITVNYPMPQLPITNFVDDPEHCVFTFEDAWIPWAEMKSRLESKYGITQE